MSFVHGYCKEVISERAGLSQYVHPEIRPRGKEDLWGCIYETIFALSDLAQCLGARLNLRRGKSDSTYLIGLKPRYLCLVSYTYMYARALLVCRVGSHDYLPGRTLCSAVEIPLG